MMSIKLIKTLAGIPGDVPQDKDLSVIPTYGSYDMTEEDLDGYDPYITNSTTRLVQTKAPSTTPKVVLSNATSIPAVQSTFNGIHEPNATTYKSKPKITRQVRFHVPKSASRSSIMSPSVTSLPSAGSSTSLVIKDQPKTTTENPVENISGNLGKLWEVPKKALRKVISDASIQKTRTSSRFTIAMIPANHAKTPENCRQDFIEDSMAPSVIDELELYKKDWSRQSEAKSLKSTIDKALDLYIETLTPIFSSNEVSDSIRRTAAHWRTLAYPGSEPNECYRELVADARSKDASVSTKEPKEHPYWSTFSYISKLHYQHNVGAMPQAGQVLFPASIARYIKEKGASHEKSCLTFYTT